MACDLYVLLSDFLFLKVPFILRFFSILQKINWKYHVGVSLRQDFFDKNKYAIHAYTHGPVTGSGPSVKPLKYVTHLLVASFPGLGS